MKAKSLDKLTEEIESVKTRINGLQAKLRVLEEQKTGMENKEIIALVRGHKVSEKEIGELLVAIREKNKDGGTEA